MRRLLSGVLFLSLGLFSLGCTKETPPPKHKPPAPPGTDIPGSKEYQPVLPRTDVGPVTPAPAGVKEKEPPAPAPAPGPATPAPPGGKVKEPAPPTPAPGPATPPPPAATEKPKEKEKEKETPPAPPEKEKR